MMMQQEDGTTTPILTTSPTSKRQRCEEKNEERKEQQQTTNEIFNMPHFARLIYYDGESVVGCTRTYQLPEKWDMEYEKSDMWTRDEDLHFLKKFIETKKPVESCYRTWDIDGTSFEKPLFGKMAEKVMFYSPINITVVCEPNDKEENDIYSIDQFFHDCGFPQVTNACGYIHTIMCAIFR